MKRSKAFELFCDSKNSLLRVRDPSLCGHELAMGLCILPTATERAQCDYHAVANQAIAASVVIASMENVESKEL